MDQDAKVWFMDVLIHVSMENTLAILVNVLLVILAPIASQVYFFIFFIDLDSLLIFTKINSLFFLAQTCEPIIGDPTGIFGEGTAYQATTGTCPPGKTGTPRRQCLHDGSWRSVVNPCA